MCKTAVPYAGRGIGAILLSLLTCLPVYAQTITPSPFWKNQIVFPEDPFCIQAGPLDPPPPVWVKFTILLTDPDTVYFQDGHEYLFHYDFATELLDPFVGMAANDYDQITLYEQGQQAILGAVIMPPVPIAYPPPPQVMEYGIQFLRNDPYSKETIRDLFNVVKANVIADPGVQAFYFPAYEQLAVAEANRDWFSAEGLPISSTARWTEDNACYSEGWALGELKFFPGDQIEYAYRAGELLPGDILLTDGVPAEIPFVAGIITLAPSAPSSHVAILARTFGVPFVYLAAAEHAERAQQLVGRRIVLRVYDDPYRDGVKLIDTQTAITEDQVGEILALKTPPALDIQPVSFYGEYSAPADNLLPSSIEHFGGKASNLGILRRAIPGNSPVSAAFSFDLWTAFLDQELDGGNTLRAEIGSRLSGYAYPPADMAALADQLESIRNLLKDTSLTHFSHDMQNAVIDTLTDSRYGFEPDRNIRFRSSTNVEDSEHFTGAGLYDSYSGCLADELDADENGPCLCDSARVDERGVFRAIRRVFASFYNDNAYLERLRHGIDENQVGMALLVHHSFPDEIELANGVATLERGYGTLITMVTQAGAVSVANAEDGSIPEEVTVSVYASEQFYPDLRKESNLVPLGATVMQWEEDYLELARLLVAAAEEYERVTGKISYVLDFEYKKVAPAGDLVVKQIREIPLPDNTPGITPFLVNEPVEYCTYQGECGDVFSNHRLKSRVRFETRSLWLSPGNLGETFFTEVALEYVADGRIRTYTGPMALWPQADHAYLESAVSDRWAFDHLRNARRYELTTEVPDQVAPAESPVLVLSDIGCCFGQMYLKVNYDKPVLALDTQWPPGTTTRMTDTVRLYPCVSPQPGDTLQERTFTEPNGVSISTSFYWPPYPDYPTAGYTAPVARWAETLIEGYTSEPIVLHGYYSQTYRPEHHNFAEHFIFEPRLEQGIDPQTLEELHANDVRLIHVLTGGSPEDRITVYGFDDDVGREDVNNDGSVDALDVQLVINGALGIGIGGFNADVDDDGNIDAVDVQLVINAALGLAS